MKSLVLVVAAVSSLTAAAWSPSPASQPATPPSAGRTVTVTGCLQSGADAGTFVLQRVAWAASGPSKDPSAHHQSPELQKQPSAPPPGNAPALPQTLRLAGPAERLKMRDYVGHTVSVTGLLAALDAVVTPGIVLPDPQPTGDTTSRERDRAERSMQGPRVLNVRSITSVASKCDG
jgi:hypothetical protein